KEEISLSWHALELRGMILQLDEILTTSARMYASTGDRKWVKRYNYFDPILDNLVNEAGLLIHRQDLKKLAEQANTANINLDKMENQAFKQVDQGNYLSAKQIL